VTGGRSMFRPSQLMDDLMGPVKTSMQQGRPTVIEMPGQGRIQAEEEDEEGGRRRRRRRRSWSRSSWRSRNGSTSTSTSKTTAALTRVRDIDPGRRLHDHEESRCPRNSLHVTGAGPDAFRMLRMTADA